MSRLRHSGMPSNGYRRKPPAGRNPLTPIRHLEGITYWVIEDSYDIGDFVSLVLRKEWEADLRSEGRNPASDQWLTDLMKRRWVLQTIRTADVNTDSDYASSERLKQRSAEMRRAIEEYGSVIWPIVVREERFLLADGYCRYATLKDMGIQKVYAYVGSLRGT